MKTFVFIFSFPGYCRLRMHNKGGAPLAFVEFADVRFAAQALISLQGTYLLSSDRGGVRIEYARNKMAETGAVGGGSPTSGASSSSGVSSLSGMAGGTIQQNSSDSQKYSNLVQHAEMEAAKMSAAAAAAQAVQGAPLHALGLYGHHIWLGMEESNFYFLKGESIVELSLFKVSCTLFGNELGWRGVLAPLSQLTESGAIPLMVPLTLLGI